MKRIVWFAAGAAAGAGGTVYAGKKVKRVAHEAAEKLKPVNVAKSAVSSAGRAGRSLVDALREGRAAAAERESELKAVRDSKGSSVDGASTPPARGGADPTPVQIVVVDARDADVLRGLEQVRAARAGGRRRAAGETATSRRRRRR